MKFQIYLLIFCCTWSCSEKAVKENNPPAIPLESKPKTHKFTYKELPIAGNAYLRFYEFDEASSLYFEPKLIINSQKFSIKNYKLPYGNMGEIKSVSPDGNYFIMDLMVINNKKETENIGCVLIDIPNKMVVRLLKNKCEGEWNKANQWLFEGKIVVSFD